MTFLRSFTFTALFSVVASFASAQTDKKWSTKQCSDLYKAIGFFTALADKQWKKKSEEVWRYTLQSQRTILLSIKLSVTSKLETPHPLPIPRTYHLYTHCDPCV